MLRNIPCTQARLGMYIQGFGGSWINHPFWRAKFLLSTDEQVERVRASAVPYITIDDEKGVGAQDTPPVRPTPAPLPSKPRHSPIAVARAFPDAEPKNRSQRNSDRQKAVALVSRSKGVMKRVFESARLGRAVRMPEVTPIVDEITESISRNAQALLSVIRKKDADEYTYFHSVAVCTLMVNMARHLGMSETEASEFGLAGLLHDIGKMGVPDAVLNKRGRLTDDEFETMRAHPAHGHAMLAKVPDMSVLALDVCLHHHEKQDGTGYPFRKSGGEISLAARIGAICDVYDALTSDRIYKDGWEPQEAIAAMWSWDGHFDRALLFSFMQSIGVFPTGMLVMLRSNRLGVVLPNQRRASRPRTNAFYATRERCFLTPETVVIKDDLSGDQIIALENPRHWGFDDWDQMRDSVMRGVLPKVSA